MHYLFGIDGGGSGCRVVLTSNDGKFLGKAKGGPANIETSFLNAKRNIIKACKTAFKSANLSEKNFTNDRRGSVRFLQNRKMVWLST